MERDWEKLAVFSLLAGSSKNNIFGKISKVVAGFSLPLMPAVRFHK
jgi:hypothetical protein